MSDDSHVLFGETIGMKVAVFKTDIRNFLDFPGIKWTIFWLFWMGTWQGALEHLFSPRSTRLGLESMAQFLDDLSAAQVTPTDCDKLVWLPSPKKGFQIKGYYRVLQERAADMFQFPWKCIWKTLSPVSFCVCVCVGGSSRWNFW